MRPSPPTACRQAVGGYPLDEASAEPNGEPAGTDTRPGQPALANKELDNGTAGRTGTGKRHANNRRVPERRDERDAENAAGWEPAMKTLSKGTSGANNGRERGPSQRETMTARTRSRKKLTKTSQSHPLSPVTRQKNRLFRIRAVGDDGDEDKRNDFQRGRWK